MKIFTKTFALFLFFSSYSFHLLHAKKKNSFYETLGIAEKNIGYTDTILYNPNQVYSQFGYQGNAPLFVQIWFPIAQNYSGRKLAYSELRNQNVPNNLQQVYDSLKRLESLSMIEYYLTYHAKNGQEIIQTNKDKTEALKALLNFKTISVRANLTDIKNLPVIIYHHGAQGLSHENFIMAEYFAAHGYVFISANFHLPFKNQSYGSFDFGTDFTLFVKPVVDFAQTFSNNLHFIGHSWGAQVGFLMLHHKTFARAFVSMETTIEFKSDSTKIAELWPEINELIQVKKVKYLVPTLMLANTKKQKPFSFFENSLNNKSYFASYKKEFTHESYTSGFLLKFFCKNTINVPDKFFLKKQVKGYAKHLNLIHNFFIKTSNNQLLKPKHYKSFYLISVNNKT